MITNYIRVGALLRRHFKTQLLTNGIQFTENKGLLETDFVITADEATWRMLLRWVQEVQEAG